MQFFFYILLTSKNVFSRESPVKNLYQTDYLKLHTYIETINPLSPCTTYENQTIKQNKQ